MKFSLSQREKAMLVGLIIVVLVAVFFRFIYLPVTLEKQSAQLIHDSVIAEEAALMENVLSKAEMMEKIHDLQRTSRLLTKQLPPSVEQEYVISDVISIASNNNVELLSLSFESDNVSKENNGVESVDDALAIYEASMDQKTDKINDLKNMFSRESATTEEENSEHEDDLPIDYMTLNITCRGLYNNLKTLLRDYNDLDNMVIVKEITFAKEGDSMAGVMANITFDFPYYQDNSSYELEAWPGGPIKDNDVDPFNYFIRGSALDPNVERSNYNNSIINSNAISDYINPLIPTKTVSYVDFYINARPKSSDDFAYTIGKKGDNANRLSSDLDGEELALHIVEVDGKPAFKLGTKLRPINEHTKAVLFSPQEGGTVNVDILSQPRVGNKDLTKAILTVKNTTAFPVKIRIKDEDVDSPRVVIMKEGNVTVE